MPRRQIKFVPMYSLLFLVVAIHMYSYFTDNQAKHNEFVPATPTGTLATCGLQLESLNQEPCTSNQNR